MDRPFPAYEGDDPYIFVSYAHADDAVVYREIGWLYDQGFNVWYDEGISPTHEWREELAESIECTSLFLYFITPSSIESDNCRRELHFAIDHGTPVLAVHLLKTDLTSGVDLTLSSNQAILKHELSDREYHTKLLKSVSDHTLRGPARPDQQTSVGVKHKTVIGLCALVSIISIVVAVVATSPDAPTREPTVMRFKLDLGVRASQDLAGWTADSAGHRKTPERRPMGLLVAQGAPDARDFGGCFLLAPRLVA